MSTALSEQDARFAGEFNPDVSVESIASVYAEALLDAAEAKSVAREELLEEFDSLLLDLCAAQPHFETLLGSAMIRTDEKIAMIDRTLGNQGSPLFVNFLKTVARHGRLDILRPIHRQTRVAYDVRIGRTPVVVTSATELDDAAQSALKARLAQLLGSDPVLRVVVDPELIGGLVVRVGDTIYDASILTQLKNVRQQMIDRSAHEIQSRRDSFRYPEGN